MLLALSLSIAFVMPVVSQQDEPPADGLSIGSVALRLGMSKDTVLARLSGSYEVQSGFVRTKSGPPFDALGSIGFDNQDRLNFISRDWGPLDQQAGVPFAEALYSALSQVTRPTQSGPRSCACNISIVETPSPRGTQRQVFFSAGGLRTVNFNTIRFQSVDRSLPMSAVVITETVRR